MTERPTPDLAILETRVYRGANVWSYDKAIHLVVDLGSLEKFPTNTIPGFTDNLLEMLPGLREHSCSRGKRGGFVERLNEGTWLGHVAEHAALALQQVVGPRHTARQDPRGEGRAGALQRGLRLRRRAGRPGRREARRPAGQPPRPGRPGARLGPGARVVHPPRRADGVRALDPGDPRRGGLPGHPVDPAQPVLAGPARPGRPRQADPGHDDLGDVRDRRRHRLRQGPHHPAARRGGPAGPEAGLRAHRGPGRPGRGADRLPGRGQAARRQPRPRRLPRPEERGRRPRGVPDRQGAVAARRDRGRVADRRQGLPLPDHRRPGRGDRRARARLGDRRRQLDRRAARRHRQRRPAARRRPREGADPDQGRRRGDRAGPRAGLRDDRRTARGSDGEARAHRQHVDRRHLDRPHLRGAPGERRDRRGGRPDGRPRHRRHRLHLPRHHRAGPRDGRRDLRGQRRARLPDAHPSRPSASRSSSPSRWSTCSSRPAPPRGSRSWP